MHANRQGSCPASTAATSWGWVGNVGRFCADQGLGFFEVGQDLGLSFDSDGNAGGRSGRGGGVTIDDHLIHSQLLGNSKALQDCHHPLAGFPAEPHLHSASFIKEVLLLPHFAWLPCFRPACLLDHQEMPGGLGG